MPRYVILLHEMPPGGERPTHWDLMLELGGSLRTWALAAEPALETTCDAQQLADHRLAYLDYEGPVSGDRGSVTRWDAGRYHVESESDEELAVTLRGGRLVARATLLRRESDDYFWRVSFSAAPRRG